MGTFAVASLLCGLAQTIGQLIAARAVQGIGGGAIQALAFAIVGDVLPPRVPLPPLSLVRSSSTVVVAVVFSSTYPSARDDVLLQRPSFRLLADRRSWISWERSCCRRACVADDRPGRGGQASPTPGHWAEARLGADAVGPGGGRRRPRGCPAGWRRRGLGAGPGGVVGRSNYRPAQGALRPPQSRARTSRWVGVVAAPPLRGGISAAGYKRSRAGRSGNRACRGALVSTMTYLSSPARSGTRTGPSTPRRRSHPNAARRDMGVATATIMFSEHWVDRSCWPFGHRTQQDGRPRSRLAQGCRPTKASRDPRTGQDRCPACKPTQAVWIRSRWVAAFSCYRRCAADRHRLGTRDARTAAAQPRRPTDG